MTIWIDAQLSPALAKWVAANFSVEAYAVRDLGLRQAIDSVIFMAARGASAVVMSKDSDFVNLLDQHGPPPQVIWVTCGNTSNARMKEILLQKLQPALRLLDMGEQLVEITDKWR
jgi:predicted nuclease of predicted toxin-antitoxin system